MTDETKIPDPDGGYSFGAWLLIMLALFLACQGMHRVGVRDHVGAHVTVRR